MIASIQGALQIIPTFIPEINDTFASHCHAWKITRLMKLEQREEDKQRR